MLTWRQVDKSKCSPGCGVNEITSAADSGLEEDLEFDTIQLQYDILARRFYKDNL